MSVLILKTVVWFLLIFQILTCQDYFTSLLYNSTIWILSLWVWYYCPHFSWLFIMMACCLVCTLSLECPNQIHRDFVQPELRWPLSNENLFLLLPSILMFYQLRLIYVNYSCRGIQGYNGNINFNCILAWGYIYGCKSLREVLFSPSRAQAKRQSYLHHFYFIFY